MDCPHCHRLRDAFDDIVKRNIALLEEFTPAVLKRENERIETIRQELSDIEARRREARLKLMAHQSSHDHAVAAGGAA